MVFKRDDELLIVQDNIINLFKLILNVFLRSFLEFF